MVALGPMEHLMLPVVVAVLVRLVEMLNNLRWLEDQVVLERHHQ
jgi:hypothetical protein